ncbi:MAG: TRAP transporter small permease [Hyphomicrobiales bacterium]|nr:TRAP transporter small permease [Hyphomicrobiales bacterium]
MQRSAIATLLEKLSAFFALFGGLILIAMTVLTVVSIVGRGFSRLGFGPVPGDYELIQMGTAAAVFCFLPWCQLHRAHVSVDLIASRIGHRADAVLGSIHNLLMSAVTGFILWRLWVGMFDKMKYHETTFILQIPVWWGYAVCVPMAVLALVVSVFTVWRSIGEARGIGVIQRNG